jgi:hypothetical protein
MHWGGPGSLTCFDTRSLRHDDKHPTEKPLDLALSLVSWFSDPADLVLDPVAGAGTTGLACRLLGRDCVQVEIDAAFAGRARDRAAAALSPRDRERAERWIEYQHAWLAGSEPDSRSGRVRYAHARADTARVVRALRG